MIGLEVTTKSRTNIEAQPALIDCLPFLSFKGLRPMRHVHFFTETVAASHNGPAELYLDSVSANQVGSSLLESHKYAVLGGKEKVKVQGVTLTSILERVLSEFGTEMVYPTKPGVKTHTSDRTNGGSGHLILKIDIEGGEYGVLRESLESGMLCDYAKRDNRVDLVGVVEFHKWVIEDKKVSIST